MYDFQLIQRLYRCRDQDLQAVQGSCFPFCLPAPYSHQDNQVFEPNFLTPRVFKSGQRRKPGYLLSESILNQKEIHDSANQYPSHKISLAKFKKTPTTISQKPPQYYSELRQNSSPSLNTDRIEARIPPDYSQEFNNMGLNRLYKPREHTTTVCPMTPMTPLASRSPLPSLSSPQITFTISQSPCHRALATSCQVVTIHAREPITKNSLKNLQQNSFQKIDEASNNNNGNRTHNIQLEEAEFIQTKTNAYNRAHRHTKTQSSQETKQPTSGVLFNPVEVPSPLFSPVKQNSTRHIGKKTSFQTNMKRHSVCSIPHEKNSQMCIRKYSSPYKTSTVLESAVSPQRLQKQSSSKMFLPETCSKTSMINKSSAKQSPTRQECESENEGSACTHSLMSLKTQSVSIKSESSCSDDQKQQKYQLRHIPLRKYCSIQPNTETYNVIVSKPCLVDSCHKASTQQNINAVDCSGEYQGSKIKQTESVAVGSCGSSMLSIKSQNSEPVSTIPHEPSLLDKVYLARMKLKQSANQINI